MDNIRKIPVSQIKPNSYNPNEMLPQEFEDLKVEMKHRGNPSKPIAVRKIGNNNYEIVDGEHEFKAAKELGFKELFCEILDIDEVEARRETYKRNLRGKNNQVKLGGMFEEVLKEKNWSQSRLAKEFNISEGTVRNALLYSKASQIRNGYDFTRLSIRQVRLYVELPLIIRDKWLDAGADPEVLWIEEPNVYKVPILNAPASKWRVIRRLLELYNEGLADMIDSSRFRASVREIYAFLKEENAFLIGKDDKFKAELRQYSKFYIKSFKDFVEIFPLIYDSDKRRFVITLGEFAEIMKSAKGDNDFVVPAIQELLGKKGLLVKAPTKDPREEKIKQEIEENAPEYIKNANLPWRLRWYLWKYEPLYVEDQAVIEQAKKETIQSMEGVYTDRTHFSWRLVQNRIDERIENIRKTRIPEDKLIPRIVRNLAIHKNDPKRREQFMNFLSQLTTEEKRVLDEAASIYKQTQREIKEMKKILDERIRKQ